MTRIALPRTRSAVTLIELLIVLGLMGILISLLVPAVQQARGAAARISCQNRMRQIGLGLHGYHDMHGAFPPGEENNTHQLSWRVKILPFVDNQLLWDQATQALKQEPVPWKNPPHVGLSTVVPVFTCPVDPLSATPQQRPDGTVIALSSYLGVKASYSQMNDGVLPFNRPIRLSEISDGTSQTVMVGERPPPIDRDSGWWYCAHSRLPQPYLLAWIYARDHALYAEMYGPIGCTGLGPYGAFQFGPGRIDNVCDMYHFWSLHPGGASFIFADGSVRFLSYSAKNILPQLASRNGGEAIEIP